MKRARCITVALALMVVACGPSTVPEGASSTPAPRSPSAASPTMIAQRTASPPEPPTTPEHPAAPAGAPTSRDGVGPAPTPDLQGFATAPAPGELGSVALPDDFTAVTAVFEHLPPEIAGHTRAPQQGDLSSGQALVRYGADRGGGSGASRGPLLALAATDLARGSFFPPNWSGGQVVAEMARHGEEIKDAGRDGDLIWARRDTFIATAESQERLPVSMLLWGRIDSSWMFSVTADSPANRDALLAAFVAAARAAGQ